MKANEPTETHSSLIAGHGFSESVVPLASPSRVKMPPRFLMVCVLTHLIQKLEGRKEEWDKNFSF